MKMPKDWNCLSILLVAGVFTTACEPWTKVKAWFGLGEAPPASSVVISPESQSRTQQNQELLGEMLRVVFNREDSEDSAEFESLTQSLEQGASLEGIYRGLIAGTRYRTLEAKGQGASPAELKVFASEMAEIDEGMLAPTRFDPKTAKLPPAIEFPEGEAGVSPDSPDSVLAEPPAPPAKKDKNQRIQELLQMFIGASSYTLKRVLSEEGLRRLDEGRGQTADRARWYAGLAVRFSTLPIDFGVNLRKKPDFEFHFKFAMTMPEDRLKWELLNRYHRLLNAAGLKGSP